MVDLRHASWRRPEGESARLAAQGPERRDRRQGRANDRAARAPGAGAPAGGEEGVGYGHRPPRTEADPRGPGASARAVAVDPEGVVAYVRACREGIAQADGGCRDGG